MKSPLLILASCFALGILGARSLSFSYVDAALLLALGKLCLHQGLWGKSQNYLEASISVAPSRPAYTALARLLEKMHKPDEAFRYYQKSVELANNG